MNQLAGGLARVSGGYELGLFGMEGRGLYAGVNAAGLHAGWSRNGGFSYGFEEQVYIGSGNNSLDVNGKRIGNMVGFELWLPTLGKYGHFALGQRYDVSKEGMAIAQRGALYEIFDQFKNDPEAIRLKELYVDSERGAFTIKYANDLDAWLLSVGMEHVDHPNHGDGSEKLTYRWATPGKRNINYGNIEFCVGPNWNKNAAYGSYNYGNNVFSHILIDYFGWKGRGY